MTLETVGRSRTWGWFARTLAQLIARDTDIGRHFRRDQPEEVPGVERG